MRSSYRRFLMAGAVLALVVPCALAQDDLGWANDPNNEPGANDALFNRTDSGNVAQAAQMAYATGLRDLKSAAKMEQKLATLEGKKYDATKAKIAKAYERAAGSFQDAIRTNPKMIQAYAGLGEAFRASGKYAESLQVSAQGLKLAPQDEALFAGWAESIMGLDMLGDATQAYTKLRQSSPARAGVLMGVMKGWLLERRADPGEMDPGDVERLAAWIQQQEGVGG